MKSLKFYTVLVLIAALVGAIIYLRYFAPHEVVTRRTIDPPAIVQQIQELRELVTVKYVIQKVIGLEEEKVPFGSESLLMVAQATVTAGIDLSELTADNVKVDNNGRVTIKLPPAKIFDVAINDKETKVFQRSKTWWTPWVDFNLDMEKKARLAARESIQNAATRTDILRTAQSNAERTIRIFLRTVGIESVTFNEATATPAAGAH